MRFIIEKIDDLTGEKGCCFADADFEFTRGTLGDCNIAIILGELDGESFYDESFLRSGRTINAYIAQGECQTTAVEYDTEALEGGFFELCPDASIRSVRPQRMELKLQLIGRIGVAQICLI
jgi:hypothetical protein